MKDCKEHYAAMYDVRMGLAGCPFCEIARLKTELNEWQKQVCGQGDVIFLLRERLHKFENDMMPFEYNKGGNCKPEGKEGEG
jgi:hypothetical protein